MIKVAPSILSADFSRLQEEVKRVEDAGADLLHIDVMDGHFVPNITVGPPVISSLRQRCSLPFDVHLMIENPERYVEDFIKAGADILTVHVESTVHINRLVQSIRDKGALPAVALNPGTPLNALDYILEDVHMVLLMTVNPGFGGQSFIKGMLKKIRELKSLIVTRNLDVLIQVDGGINEKNALEVVNAGADILVAGSAVYNSPDPASVIRKLKNLPPL
ncbi:ribulose-phosphate 3-epimerase [Thermosediminibacter litoriperuensis]|uniref:Ribulose-phosphate 3-epimerase n=1 Tax=Thermosediminibacter litoriperuensis TaxID=291989 RepID=A0A5S5B0T8_9FIRM|nr:ribulose-phosphate 3-epimerase [Thermosediminibacter litoriperuensis]TYP59992.1 ribulose-5-phosphate 3-epimerase [Thermosediminibacter litoriperuensis]